MSHTFSALNAQSVQDLLIGDPSIEDCIIINEFGSSNERILVFIRPNISFSLGKLIQKVNIAFTKVLISPIFSNIVLTIVSSHEYGALKQITRKNLFAMSTRDGKTLLEWNKAFSSSLDTRSNGAVNNELAVAYGGALYPISSNITTLSQALNRAADQNIERGIIYLQSDGSENYQSYRELREGSLSVLVSLYNHGLRPGDKVILQIEDNQEYLTTIWACFLGGIVVIPLPVPTNYQKSNQAAVLLRKVWEYCEHPVIITNQKLFSTLQKFSVEFGLRHFQVKSITLQKTEDELRERLLYIGKPEEAAIIMFTSGSTGVPKGVVLAHKNILRYIESFTQYLGLSDKEITFHWLPLVHAMGLIICHIRDVYLGCQQIHTSPQTILPDPLLWIDALDRYRVTCTMTPNFAFSLVNEHAEMIGQKHWDLSSLRCLVIAGEVIVPRTVRKFLTLLAPHGLPLTTLHPHYGMTEALAISISNHFVLRETVDDDSFVEVGVPLPNVWIRIVDEENKVLMEGTHGRVQVKSPSVTSGYYHNSMDSKEMFTTDGWLDTGDTGILDKGQLTITGRTKGVIIINGRNYYSQEIEAIVEEISGISISYTAACAVRSSNSTTDSLAIFYHSQYTDYEMIRKQIGEIRKRIVASINISPTYIIPVERTDIPKTSLGKIQRAKLKQQFESGNFDKVLRDFVLERYPRKGFSDEIGQKDNSKNYPNMSESNLYLDNMDEVFPNEVEQHLIKIWQNILGINKISRQDNFFELGGDSLLEMRIVSQARALGINLTPGQIYMHQTVASLAAVADTSSRGTPEREQEIGEVLFTNGQVWQLTGATNPHYFNEGYILELRDALDPILLRQTLQELIQYHDALRLRFVKMGSEWKQFLIPPQEDLPLKWITLSDEEVTEQKSQIKVWINQIQASLDLINGPVMQLVYFDCCSRQPDRLLWICNHLVVDHFSLDILLEDFQTIYQQIACGKQPFLSQKNASFKQCTELLNNHIHSSKVQAELDYWLSLPWSKVVSIPVDYPELQKSELMLSHRTFHKEWLSSEETIMLGHVVNSQTPMIDILLFALVQSLAQWTGNYLFQISMLDSGRNALLKDVDLSRTVGYIAWARRLLLEASKDSGPEAALRFIQKQLAIIPNKGLNFELLYYLSSYKGKLKDIPPVEVQLNHLGRANTSAGDNYLIANMHGDIGERNDPREKDFFASITLMTEVIDNRLKMTWDYNEQLYKLSTIKMLSQRYLKILQDFIYPFGK